MNRSATTLLLPLLLLAALLAASCSDDAATGTGSGENNANNADNNGDLDAGNNGGDTDDNNANNANNNTGENNANNGEDAGDGLGLGEICEENEECSSRLCFYLPGTDQGFCSRYCLQDANCPEDAFACVFLQDQNDDVAKVCVPEDLCIDDDGDGFGTGPGCTGRDCDETDGDRNPAAVEVCDGVDNDCDGAVDNNPTDANLACDTGSPGICAEGQLRCILGQLECDTLRFAGREACDGLDNDCDGMTDEDDQGQALTAPCYSGPLGTADVGACQSGARTCADGEFSECIGQTLPFIEACDGQDNDCDGDTDEGMPNTGLACDTGEEGICRLGQTRCDATGAVVCEALEAPVAEVCDGIDNDCDGLIDEDDQGDPLLRACYDGPAGTEGVGVCLGGEQTCQDGTFGPCVGQIAPTAERCDTLDNNCDGMSDEGNPAGGQLCSTGLLGVCARGETMCGDDGVVCVPSAMPTDELCDTRDNDCDGAVDEAIDGGPLARSCYNGPDGTLGLGACAAGTQTCQGGTFAACVGEVRPGVEGCDGEDNDCDGTIDDGNPGGGIACSTGLPGACAAGLTMCSDGGIVCVQTSTGSAEVCDGLDNDCDGMVDEDDSGAALTRSCYNGPSGTQGVGACAAGTQTCQGGTFAACVGEVRPGVEGCDGEDNDCDGTIDDGMPGAGVACSTGRPGVCAVGVTACDASGDIVCVQSVQEGAETCDGIDNDCDGMADEDGTGAALTRSCYSGPNGTQGVGICRAGTQTCSGGVFSACGGQTLPQNEICDGLDNDCDGTLNDGNPGGNVACTTGMPGVCANGLTACMNGALACVPSATPSAETCDGSDNDCDGMTDEDGAGQPLTRPCYSGPNGTQGVGICRAGTQTCSGGVFSACGGQTLPQNEICDGLDNDCDGTLNDGNPGGGVACTTGIPGICAEGTTACQGGGIVCVQSMMPQNERCDGIDNNCNGQIDDGFPGLGQTCFAGLGICERPGVTICAANQTSTTCTATPGMGNTNEVCDYLDDDCDGMTDEPFKNGSGVYNGALNCGGCGVDCNNEWPMGPATVHVIPTCVVAGSSASCDYTCENNYFDLDLNPDNGCEFTPDPTAIYVSATSGTDNGTCGAWNAPCRTITQGLTRAQSATRTRVRVASGQYNENLTLVAGISVLGGHNASNWTRSVNIFVSTLNGSTPSPTSADRVAVTAISINSATEFSGFTINAENAAAGGNSVGIYIRNSNGSLTVRDNVVFAGAGGSGTAGGNGSSGANGANGAAGITSLRCIGNTNCTGGTGRAGGSGGSRMCGTTSVSGGAGGTSNDPRTFNRSGPGGNGNGTGGGTGGAEGDNADGTLSGGVRSCNYDEPSEPFPGSNGTAGSNGTGGGANADTDGSFNTTANQWRGAAGNNGNAGSHGGGGAGGGAAGGIDATDVNQNGVIDANPEVYFGASGGGGGSGGCAGTAGTAGSGGGGSFPIVVIFTGSGPSNATQIPVITANHLVRSAGGQGGRGGDGGAGGDPGLGANGGDGLTNDGNYGFCMFDGGQGARGGRGGHAGGGAGGNGGVSFDIFIQNINTVTHGYNTSNTFELANNVPTGGVGGSGGSSSNQTNGTGASGNQGQAGNVLAFP